MNPAEINRADQAHLSSDVYGLFDTLEITARHQTDHVRHRLAGGGGGAARALLSIGVTDTRDARHKQKAISADC